MAVQKKHTTQQKDKARKRSITAKRKALALGKDCDIFSIVAYYNPTHDQLEGAIWIPKGQSIPDMNKLVSALWLWAR